MHLMDRLVGRFTSGKRSAKDEAALNAALDTLTAWSDDTLSHLD